MHPSYLATNLTDLYTQSPKEIQALFQSGEVNTTTAILGKIYKLPVSKYPALSDVISFILIGALKPEDAVRGIVDMLGLTEEEAYKLAQDLEKSILEKARISILGKAPTDMVTLTFQEGRSPDDLRKELLDTTKRESVFAEADKDKEEAAAPGAQTAPPAKEKLFAPVGSRTQLLEQLQILEQLPTDDEVAERLSRIQEQIAGIKKGEEAMESPVALQEFMPKEDGALVVPEEKPATYSKAPTRYNVDPYREVVE